MRIHKTGHVIADTIADAFIDGGYKFDADLVYGILRHNVFLESAHWFCVDRGYFNPSHYDGYYRISYKGTQGRYDPEFPITKAFKGKLGTKRVLLNGNVLVCPPTDAVCTFFGVNGKEWKNDWKDALLSLDKTVTIRNKSDKSDIDFDRYESVVTFNSSVGWQALQHGIPCISDISHSLVGSYYGGGSYEEKANKFYSTSRQPLFDFMASQQFTLEEIRNGDACSLIKHYL